MIVALFYFLALLSLTPSVSLATSVSVLRPIDTQLPTVARINSTFAWAFLPDTFSSLDGPVRYTTSSLPGWLSFDRSTRVFSGTPSTGDEGNPEITVTAHASGSSTSSKFSLCVTSLPPPRLNIPIVEQFRDGNPSMSSVFYLHPGSAISTSSPTVRIPRKWSFSLGFQGQTYISDNDNFNYDLQYLNGPSIPDFMVWDPEAITLDGVVPPGDKIPQPTTYSFALHVVEQEGCSDGVSYFDIVVADHEMSAPMSMPTINVTASTPFAVSLLSAVDFGGVLVDDGAIQPTNITSVDINTNDFRNWLQYDPETRTLSGSPGNDAIGTLPLLPVSITSNFNQTVHTNVSIALVPSYFALPDLPSLHVSKGDAIQFNVAHWFTEADRTPDDANITVSLEPVKAANFLRYDETTTNLFGTVPADYDDASDHVAVTITAYSMITHSTSHTNVAIYIADTGHKNLSATGLSNESKKRLVLALAVTFGIVGGICLLTGLFAIIRRCARVEDTAVVGEEGRHAWSEKDRQWYGMTLSPHGTRIIEKVDGLRGSFPNLASPIQGFMRSPSRPNYGQLGLGLRRVTERSQGDQSGSNPQSPGVMSKKDFLGRIKQTVRQVSDKYSKKSKPSPYTTYERRNIGKPILITSQMHKSPSGALVQPPGHSPINPFESVPSRPGSTFMSGSPSNSTGEHSIPRRRPDFAPPRSIAQVHFADGRLSRQVSAASIGASVISGKSGISGDSYNDSGIGPSSGPRLVPFTHAGRVPMPFPGINNVDGKQFTGQRITSQHVKVCKVNSQNGELESVKPSGSNDELIMGMHYVRSLGADQLTVNGNATDGPGSSPVISRVASSFTSLESSHTGRKSLGANGDLIKILVRAGERFKFRVPVPRMAPLASRPTRAYLVRLTSGQPLPKFMQVDMTGLQKGVMEFSGLATFKELGETSIGVYTEDGQCVVMVVVEVVGKR